MTLYKHSLYFISILILSGCTTSQEYTHYKYEPRRGQVIVKNNLNLQNNSAQHLSNIAPAAGGSEQYNLGRALKAKSNKKCRIKDRFDRKELIAYQFDDDQTRLGLKMDMDGFSLSDAGNFDVQEVKINLRYRFQPYKKSKERCLYESAWQGLVGSSYNEFYLREEDTVVEKLDEEISEFHDKVEKIF